MTYRHGRYGAVAAGHGVTAAAAEEILAEGGNAFDAAIAALWTACVAEPVFASPGGGGFLMARPAAGKLTLYDFFVDTPLNKRPEDDIEFAEILADFGTATQGFHIGAGAAATPGFVPGLFAVHAAHGRIPMKRLVEPAIRAAREGVTVTAFQAFLFKVVSPILVWTAAGACGLFAGRQAAGRGAHPIAIRTLPMSSTKSAGRASASPAKGSSAPPCSARRARPGT